MGETTQDTTAHGHEQTCCDAFARDIGDDESPAILAEVDEVIVVAADDASRGVGAGNAIACDFGIAVGKEDALHFPCGAQFVF